MFSSLFFSRAGGNLVVGAMARLARVMAVDTPYHVTQRGNARQFILESEAARGVYLDLLRQYCGLHELSLIGYCLMSSHVHLIVVPGKPGTDGTFSIIVHCVGF